MMSQSELESESRRICVRETGHQSTSSKDCWADRARGSTVEEQPVLIQPSDGSAGCSGNQWRREGAWNPRHLVALSAHESAAGAEGPQPPGPAVLPRRLHWLTLRSRGRILKEFRNSPVVPSRIDCVWLYSRNDLLIGHQVSVVSDKRQLLRKHKILVIWKNLLVW